MIKFKWKLVVLHLKQSLEIANQVGGKQGKMLNSCTKMQEQTEANSNAPFRLSPQPSRNVTPYKKLRIRIYQKVKVLKKKNSIAQNVSPGWVWSMSRQVRPSEVEWLGQE